MNEILKNAISQLYIFVECRNNAWREYDTIRHEDERDVYYERYEFYEKQINKTVTSLVNDCGFDRNIIQAIVEGIDKGNDSLWELTSEGFVL